VQIAKGVIRAMQMELCNNHYIDDISSKQQKLMEPDRKSGGSEELEVLFVYK
jgi:hypothetical protein